MHADEHHLEAADEIAEGQQPEALVAGSLGDGGAHRLLAVAVAAARGFGQHRRQRRHQGGGCGQHQQRVKPAHAGDQRLGGRKHRELAERPGRAGDPQRHAALLGRVDAPEHAIDDAEGGARQPDADQHAGGERQFGAVGGVGHPDQSGDVEQGADEQHAAGAVAVGDQPGERLRHAPHQVLQGQREGKGFAPPAVGCRHRLQEQAEAVPRAHCQGHDEAAAGEDQDGRAPGFWVHVCSWRGGRDIIQCGLRGRPTMLMAPMDHPAS